jgi:hypothetical protein
VGTGSMLRALAYHIYFFLIGKHARALTFSDFFFLWEQQREGAVA